MKKWLSLVLTLALLFAVACAQAEVPKLTDEPVTFTAIASQAVHSADFNTMRFWVELEEQTGVHIDFTMWDASIVNEKLAAMLASGEYPDISFVSLGDADTYLYGQYGEIVPLNDLLEAYAPNWQAVFEQYPEVKAAITMPDGNIYALPFIRYDATNYGMRDAMLINKVWLEKLGLEMPTTTDELLEVLRAFKTQDPNGNGEADEIPFITRFDTYSNGVFDVFGWFGNYTGSNSDKFYIAVRDGQVYLTATEETYKQAVQYLHQLYSEGLLDADFATQETAEFQSKLKYDTMITGMVPLYHGATEFGYETVSENFAALPPLQTGNGEEPVSRQQLNTIERNRAVIFRTNPNPELTMRWLDVLASPEVSLKSFYGYVGTHLIAEEDGTFTPDAEPYATRTLDVPANLGGSFALTEQVVNMVNKSAGGDLLRKQFEEIYAPYRMPLENIYPNLFLTTEQNDALTAAGVVEWNSYITTTMAKWITEGGIEEEWEAYVTEVEKLTAPSLAIYQEALDVYNGK